MGKFKAGEQLRSLDEIAKQEFIFCRHKIYHRGWFMSWPVRSLLQLAEGGAIFGAVRKRRVCPHCGKPVVQSELPQYTWQCLDCDEDFYDFEFEED